MNQNKSQTLAMVCPLCKSNDTQKLFNIDRRLYSDRFSVVKCNACAIAWTDPVLDDNELEEFYPEEYYGKGDRERFLPIVEMMVRQFRKIRANTIKKNYGGSSGCILDIGCGRGWMLSILQDEGWETYGTELSEHSSSFAREVLGLKIITKDISECDYEIGYFDVVSMWHILEHIRDPQSTLKEIHRVLKDGGLAVIEVPNFGGFQAKIFGNKWLHVDAPRHLFHYTPVILKESLKDAGFKIIKHSNFSLEYDFIGFIQSILNNICFHYNFLFDFLRTPENRMLKTKKLKSLWDLGVSVLLFPFLFMISLIVVPLNSLLNSGGIIRYHCIKLSDK